MALIDVMKFQKNYKLDGLVTFFGLGEVDLGFYGNSMIRKLTEKSFDDESITYFVHSVVLLSNSTKATAKML